jgi:putative phosphoribosyl transferase
LEGGGAPLNARLFLGGVITAVIILLCCATLRTHRRFLRHPDTQTLRIGYFGASTGAGAALVAAAERPDEVGAVVSRGGRPDLAGEDLSRVEAPTLLIVGGSDVPVIGMNEEALGRMHVEKQLEIVAGATHLFEEVGALKEVARLASSWFRRYLYTRG